MLRRSLSQPKCKLCEGTGKLVLARSWFTSDGFRFGKCGVCSGTGISDYSPTGGYIASQKRMREMFGVECPSRTGAVLGKAVA